MFKCLDSLIVSIYKCMLMKKNGKFVEYIMKFKVYEIHQCN